MNILLNYLAWSEQRTKSIHTCPRQYAYKYLQAWGGWEDYEAPEKQQAYHLNCVIADLRIATGNILHDRAGRILRRIASAGIFQNRVDLLLLLGSIVKERWPGLAPARLLDQLGCDEILQDGPRHEAVVFQALCIEPHEVAEQPGIR